MLSTPGASASVLEANVPYASLALTQLLGKAPDQSVAADTARQMAATAYNRAQHLVERHTADDHLFGLGITAGLATNRVKKGQHRAHWCIQTADHTCAFFTHFDAAETTRAKEEKLLVDFVWQTLQQVLTSPTASPPQSSELSPEVSSEHAAVRAGFAPLLTNTPYKICIGEHDGNLLLPGSFNPVHSGHEQMLAIAQELTGRAGAFELAVRNADKPTLDYISLEERLARITDTPVWLTNTAIFSEKARLFPNTIFALGVDTMRRIADLRFYQGQQGLLEEALEIFVQYNTSFIVFGRAEGGKFITLDDINLPEVLRERCQPVAESDYRNDISSTALRAGTPS